MPHGTPASIRLCVACLLVSAASGVELVLHDLTAGLETLPAAFTFRLDDGIVTTSSDDAFDLALALSAGYLNAWSIRGSRHGLSLGLEGLASEQHYRSPSGDGVLRGLGVRLGMGYAVALNDQFTLLVGPSIDVGVAQLSHDAPLGSIDADGTWLRFGGSTRIRWRLPGRRWSLTAMGGWCTATHQLDGDGYELELEQSGLQFGIGCQWTLHTAPTRLE